MSEGPAAAVSRAVTATLGTLGAFLIGGVAQAVVWRWDVVWLTALTTSQFLWFLLCFLVAWAWSRGRLLAGGAAGAATGLALIASYYSAQWLVDGSYSAVDQFTDSFGLAWTAASIVGGAGVGLLGALAATSATAQPRHKAFGLVSAALVLAGGPSAWLAMRGEFAPAGTGVAALTFVSIGAGLLGLALRRCGTREALRGGAPAVVAAVTLLATLFVLQHSLLYLTY